ncbi:hypothetical protein FQA47_023758 [Oryzias melastigma]|uniref:Ig-like domain-containing protein n=1 Tax=Oryzias melastigma TaxID=30732 RepID=A0A834C275_ORYME|nr:hypothetical protein FQA47_023758 [Oryzias melastigma]
MVSMFSLNRAVLLVTLFLDFRIYEAASSPVNRREVSRGHSVTLTCNRSLEDAADVSWTKGNLSFLHSIVLNATVSNFSSPRLRIETDLPSQLMILNVQDEDEGLYSCTVTNWNGLQQTRWNLTLTEEVKEIRCSIYSFLKVPTAAGIFLCIALLVVCYYRKCGRRTESQ